MPILQVFLVIIVVGVLLWLVNRFIPMQGTIKWILNLVVVIVLIIWLLKAFGVWGSVAGAHV
ncbi:MAG: Thivi_2564 family membrane protein [Flavobacteriales bacterium]